MKYIRFLGFRQDVADLMNAIDIMALPSHCEPFGLVYTEAALLGKPVLACASGGAPEVVTEGETGLLVPPKAPEAIANAITTLLGDRALMQRMGHNGHMQAVELYNWDKFLDGLEMVYRKL